MTPKESEIPMPELKLTRFPTQKDETFIKDWHALLAQTDSQFAFSDPAWLSAWWNVFGAEHQPLTYALYEGDRLVGVFPLMLTSGKHSRHCRLMGTPQVTHVEFPVLPAYREAGVRLLMQALEERKGSVLFDFSGLNNQSWPYRALLSFLQAAHRRFLSVEGPSPVIHIGGQAYQTYFKNKFSTHNRRHMRRNRTRLEALGEVTFRPLRAEDMPAVFALHGSRWKEKVDTSGFDDVQSQFFFTALLSYKDAGWKAMPMGLFLDTRMIAFQYGFLCNGRALFYRSAHENLLSIYAPGKQIKQEYIRFCFENAARTVDFGIGYEEYKAEWTDAQDTIANLYFPKSDIASQLRFILPRLKYTLKAALKKHRRIVLFRRNTLGKVKYALSFSALRTRYRRASASVKRQGLFCYLLGKLHLPPTTALQYTPGQENPGSAAGKSRVSRAGVGDMQELALLFNLPVGEVARHFYRQDECLLIKKEDNIVCAAFFSAAENSTATCRAYKKSCREQDAAALMAEIGKRMQEKGGRLFVSGRLSLRAAKQAGFKPVPPVSKQASLD